MILVLNKYLEADESDVSGMAEGPFFSDIDQAFRSLVLVEHGEVAEGLGCFQVLSATRQLTQQHLQQRQPVTTAIVTVLARQEVRVYSAEPRHYL